MVYTYSKNLIFIIHILDTMNLWQTLTLLLIFVTLFIQDVMGKAAKKVAKPAKKPAKPAAKASKKKKQVEED